MIKPIEHILNIDLANKINMNQSINIKKNDTNSHKFIINIFNNSVVYDLTGTTSRIYFQKSDGTKVFLDCALDVALTGKLSCLLTTQALSYTGLVASEITIYGTSGEILTSVTFNFTVSEVIRDDMAIESTSEFTALTDALAIVTNITLKADKTYVDSQDLLTSNKVGSLISLTTSNKTDLVNAINENVSALAEMTTDFNVKDFGASTSALWSVNRDAFQQANDACYAVGGGRVLIPNGLWSVKGVLQDSHVEFYGKGATLVHPDGLTENIIESRKRTTTGSINIGSVSLTVASTDNIEVGAVVSIRGAGGKSIRQTTQLASDITATATTIPLTDITAFASAEYAVIQNEIISWIGISENSLTGVQRGLFGTTAITHASGVVFWQSCRNYNEVIAINGNVLTLNTPVLASVANTDIVFGIVNPKVTNVNFDGKRVLPSGEENVVLLRWSLVRWGIVDKGEYKNGELGGIQLLHGSRDCVINMPVIMDTGKPSLLIGAVIWMFRGCMRNTVIAPILLGDCYNGIYIDDRTSISTEWDAPSDGNIIIAPNINLKRNGSNSSINIVGSRRNKVLGGNIGGSRSGVIIDSNQSYTYDGTKAPADENLIDGVSISDVYYNVSLSASGNRIANCPWDDGAVIQDTGGNVLVGNGRQFRQLKMPTGYHFLQNSTSTATSDTQINTEMRLVPFNCPRQLHITELGLEVVVGSASTATAEYRFGVYRDDGTGKVGSLYWDSGLVTASAVTVGVNYITMDLPLPVGDYYIAVTLQGTSGAVTVRVPANISPIVATTTRPTTNLIVMGYSQIGISGSFPSTLANVLPVTDVPRLYIKVD